jgi:hypothetical protein
MELIDKYYQCITEANPDINKSNLISSSSIRSGESIKTNYKYIIPSSTLCGSPENNNFGDDDLNSTDHLKWCSPTYVKDSSNHLLPIEGLVDWPSPTLRSEESLKKIENLDSVVTSVINSFIKRSTVGLKKYGTNLDRNDLSFLDWIQHAQEEHMDAILYLEKIKQITEESIIKNIPLTKGGTTYKDVCDNLCDIKMNLSSQAISNWSSPTFLSGEALKYSTLHSTKTQQKKIEENEYLHSFIPSNK